VIRVEDVRKRFGELVAVDGVSFEVRAAEIYGLLGPNGAGKTTTLSMICGLLAPDAGRITIDGRELAREPRRLKSLLGVVPQEVSLYEELSARENLRFWGGLYGLSGKALDDAVARVLGRVGLETRAAEPVKRFSGGMKRRLNLALGIVHGPRAVLLDEPTVGIDPQGRASVLEVVGELVAGGTAVLYTTHYLEEAESLCTRIGIMDHGRILAEGTVEALKRRLGEHDVVSVRGAFTAEAARRLVEGEPAVRVLAAAEGRLDLAAAVEDGAATRVLSRILRSDLAVDDVSIRPPSLNALFLELTGRELRDG
jgi:ABC-2 type transport system ATP-binding protein